MKTITRIITLFLIVMALIFVPQISAKPEYLTSLDNIYPSDSNSCHTCHVDPNGGSNLTTYGDEFLTQLNDGSNDTDALVTIGAPNNMAPNMTMTPTPKTQVPDTINTSDMQTPTDTASPSSGSSGSTDNNPTATVTGSPTETLATQPNDTLTAEPTETIVEPTVAVPQQTENVAEVTDTPIPAATQKAPTIGIIVAIGIIGLIYIMRKR